jgi:hypothetical protein
LRNEFLFSAPQLKRDPLGSVTTMTHDPRGFADVLAVIERYLSGQLSFDAAADTLDPVLRAWAEHQERIWRQYERRPGDPISLTKLSAEKWLDPNVGRGEPMVITPLLFAPGRSREDEEARSGAVRGSLSTDVRAFAR